MQSLKQNARILLPAFLMLGVLLFTLLFHPTSSNLATSETSSRLRHRLETEQPLIEEAFTSRFTFLTNNDYAFTKIVLLDKGNYAAILLTSQQTTHRVLLEKTDNGWVVVNLPAIVLSYTDFSNYPTSLLDTINNLEKSS